MIFLTTSPFCFPSIPLPCTLLSQTQSQPGCQGILKNNENEKRKQKNPNPKPTLHSRASDLFFFFTLFVF